MKKVFGLIFILLGGLLIGGGIFVQVSGTNTFNVKQNKNESVSLTRADTKGGTITCDGKMIDSYLQLNDFTKVSFAYPDCVSEPRLSYKSKQLSSTDRSIRIDISRSSDKPKGFLNNKRTYLISLKEDEYYDDFDFSEIKEMKIDGITFYYFNVTYNSISMFDKSKTVRDEWYISVPHENSETKENYIITFSVVAYDKVVGSSAIENMIKSLKFEENKAVYNHSKEEGNYLVGSIKQNKNNSSDHGYIITYKAPKDVPEVDAISTDINKAVFELEELNTTRFITISVDNTGNAKEEAESYHKVIDQDKENYKNRKTSEVKFKAYNNHNMYYFISSHDYYNSETNKYLYTEYVLYCFVDLGEKDFIEVNMRYKSIPITEKELEKYLNFTVEEY